jgi:bacterioferritin
MAEPTGSTNKFALDLEKIRKDARDKLDRGAVTPDYAGSVEQAIDILNDALATETVCVLRYKFHAVAATGINSEAVKEEFLEHAAEEQEHADALAERINQLGGKPAYNPAELLQRSATEFVEGDNLIDMIREDLIAERIAIETYREMIKYFAGTNDPTSRRLLEGILAKEEEHAQDMHDLLVAHEGQPMLEQ